MRTVGLPLPYSGAASSNENMTLEYRSTNEMCCQGPDLSSTHVLVFAIKCL